MIIFFAHFDWMEPVAIETNENHDLVDQKFYLDPPTVERRNLNCNNWIAKMKCKKKSRICVSSRSTLDSQFIFGGLQVAQSLVSCVMRPASSAEFSRCAEDPSVASGYFWSLVGLYFIYFCYWCKNKKDNDIKTLYCDSHKNSLWVNNLYLYFLCVTGTYNYSKCYTNII